MCIRDRYKGFIGGEFRLGIIPTVMPTLLPMFLNNFTKKYSKVKLIIEELTTEEIIKKLSENHLDAGLAATPLENEAIKEMPLYYEPFVGLIPKEHRLFHKKEIKSGELEMEDILLLEDGHCFKDSVINLCSTYKTNNNKGFKLESGSFDTLIKLSKEGLGMTLLPYLHTLDLNEKDKKLDFNYLLFQSAIDVPLGQDLSGYFGAHLGINNIKPNWSESDTYFATGLYGGVEYHLSEAMRVSFETRWLTTIVDNNSKTTCEVEIKEEDDNCLWHFDGDLLNQFQTSIGFSYRF